MGRYLKLLPLMLAVVLSLCGCGISIPTDPLHTLERVRDGHLRIGVSTNEPWVTISREGVLQGSEIDLVRSFAASVNSQIRWVHGGEESLVAAMERGELDIIAGGLTDETPWTEKAATTRPYSESTDPEGVTLKHVLLVRMGENAFLSELEKFLDGRS
ncbi:transporter substrate-binding domain-containing protein [Paeniglutamicibacter sp. Y32M11]|uniref:transporter substrate-binding domain-containing protein n=1 Tax=Paeniglutamicibacter sp. Y32M11 TaxID=2853258 RepID=UPI002106F3F9|nr:transporter substrate-binding domain-containing protein [Paeniglutamicibacter sp. Y32M11]